MEQLLKFPLSGAEIQPTLLLKVRPGKKQKPMLRSLAEISLPLMTLTRINGLDLSSLNTISAFTLASTMKSRKVFINGVAANQSLTSIGSNMENQQQITVQVLQMTSQKFSGMTKGISVHGMICQTITLRRLDIGMPSKASLKSNWTVVTQIQKSLKRKDRRKFRQPMQEEASVLTINCSYLSPEKGRRSCLKQTSMERRSGRKKLEAVKQQEPSKIWREISTSSAVHLRQAVALAN